MYVCERQLDELMDVIVFFTLSLCCKSHYCVQNVQVGDKQHNTTRHFVSPNDTVEIACSLPLGHAYTCHFYREWICVKFGSCSNKLTGWQLGLWAKRTAMLPVNMTCKYDPHPKLDLHSKPSNHLLLLVVGEEPQSGG